MNLTQEELAERIDTEMTRQAISRWERGPAAYPDVDHLLALSVILKISIDELFVDELAYCRKEADADNNKLIEKYPGLIAGLKAFQNAMKNMDL